MVHHGQSMDKWMIWGYTHDLANLNMDMGWELGQRHLGLWGLVSDVSHSTELILRYEIFTHPHRIANKQASDLRMFDMFNINSR